MNIKRMSALNLAAALVCVIVLPVLGPYPGQAQDLAEFEKRVTEFTLDNGLHFLVLERHEAPVVSFHTYADVGSANEVKGITGIAHLLEHMAFKGTKKVGTSNYAAEIWAIARLDAAYKAMKDEENKGDHADEDRLEKLRRHFKDAQEEAGAYVVTNELPQALSREGSSGLNAFTSTDATQYVVSLPSNKLELWMSLESDRYMNPVLREFYKERDVVCEERRMMENRPQGRLWEEFMAAAFKAHPYGEPIVGHMSDITTVSREQVEEFFATYYTPRNLTVGIVGDVDPAQVKRLAKLYFGRIPAGPPPKPVVTVEPPQAGPRRVIVEDKAQPQLIFGYHVPVCTHPDRPVLDVITDITARGRTARLYKSLVRDRKIAVGAWSGYGMPGDKFPCLFVFGATPAKEHTNQECLDAILEEIERLKSEPVTGDELEKAKTRARAGLIRRLASNRGLAYALTNYEVVTGDWRNMFAWLDEIQRVTAEDVRRVAAEYFTSRNRTLAMIETAETALTGPDFTGEGERR